MTKMLVQIDTAELASIVRSEVAAALEAHAAAAANGPPPAEWLDAKEAARVLGVHPRTVSAMAARRDDGSVPRLRSTRIGRLLRFRRADVMGLLERDEATVDHG